MNIFMNAAITINPFDPKTALFAKHAQHVVLIHFPIALFLSGVLFDFVATWTKNAALATAAYFNSLFAAVTTIPAIATGILAWQLALEGQKLKGILLMHLVLGWISALFICAAWFLHRRARRKGGASTPRYRLVIESIGVIIVSLTAHLGGFLSGVNLTN